MEMMEIILLVLGVAAIVASFFLNSGKGEQVSVNKDMAQSEIKELVAAEMKEIQQQVNDTVEEAVAYAMEKTERSLERISNEKIMAVNEYSDTVLAQINKNHQEVIFLYDMLNDKHTSLKKTATVVEKKAKEAEIIANEAFEVLQPIKVDVLPQEMTEKAQVKTTRKRQTKPKEKEPKVAEAVNSNERILELHKSGKTKVQIAQELGVGVGEVELVIGLFKDRKL